MSSPRSAPKRTVAIVGAGPGGLVAAQKLLRTNALIVTIFDRQDRVGGLWERNNLINPQMQANFCMFTVAFSDLSWNSVDLGNGKPCPMYPRAWMVEKYLEVYKERYLGDAEWRLGTNVTNAQRVCGEDVKKGKAWKLTSVKTAGDGEILWEEEVVEFYDFLLVATGYLSKPKSLSCEIDEVLRNNSPIPIIHSTQFRKIEQLDHFDNSASPPSKKKVLVIGGSHSGSEIATLIALQASNSHWTPPARPTTASLRSELEIIHITSHQMLAVPGFVRNPMSPVCSFLPMEYQLYERSMRDSGPLSHTFGLTSPEESIPMKMMIETQLIGEPTPPVNEMPAYVVVSENYTQFVESKTIQPRVGRLKRLYVGARPGEVTATVMTSDGEMMVDGITAVINATGFDSCDSIRFLSDDVLDELGYEETSIRLPLVLDASYMAQRSTAPDIAVLGFTGVNWGVMEMQSRAIAAKWSASAKASAATDQSSMEIAEHINILRDAMKRERKNEIPQVLFGDYLGLMEQAARELGVERVDSILGPNAGMVCPARYTDAGAEKSEAEKQIHKLLKIQSHIQTTGLFIARAVFHGLSGDWAGSNGSLIQFHPRQPTAQEYEFEYISVETLAGKGEERKIYRYDEVNDSISVWSVSQMDRLSPEAIIHTIQFSSSMTSPDPSSCTATVLRKSNSACEAVPVLAYTFDFKGSLLNRVHIERESKCLGSTTEDFARAANDVPITGCQFGIKTGEVHGQLDRVDSKIDAQWLEGLPRENPVKVLKGNCCHKLEFVP